MTTRHRWCYQPDDAKRVRVQIPPYTDRWMMGDRYGEVLATSNGIGGSGPLFRVKLDKSGKTIACIADDCTVV